MNLNQNAKTKGFGLHRTRRRYFSLFTSASFVMMLFLCFFTFCPYYNQELKTSAEGAPNAVSSELILDVTNNEANLEFSATGGEYGSFASSGESITFVATTNNTSGYTLRYIGGNDTGALLHTEADFKFLSITSPLTTNDFSALANTGYNNQWGFKPSKYVSNGITVDNAGETGVFLPIPTTAGVIIDRTDAPNSGDNSMSAANNYSIEIGARAGLDIVAGEYTGNFNLSIIANPVSYRITYDAGNTTDEVTGLPETQNSSTSDTTITLPTDIPSREHYQFIGWCDVMPTTTDGTDSCTGTNAQTGDPAIQFAAGGEYGINQTTSNNATLYAMWDIEKFNQTTKIRYENADGTWSSFEDADTQLVRYGESYSWEIAATVSHQAASVPSYVVTESNVNEVSIYRNVFACIKQYRLENADGTWGGYTIDVSETVRYGGTCSYSKSITNYRGGSEAANSTAATTEVTNAAEDVTLSLSLYRNIFTCSIQSRDQAANGTYGAYTSRVSSTLRYGQTCAWSAAADATYKAVSYSVAISANVAQSLNRDRQVYTCYIQSRHQNANATYTGYTARVNTTMLAGNTCAWSSAADTTYQAASYSTAISGNVSQSLDINRQVYTCYIQSRHQNADGSYTGYTARVNTTMLAGNTCAWSSGADAAYQAAGYSAAISGNISASVDINRQVYGCYIQSRHQNADGTYTGYTARVNTSLRYGQTCAWSSGADAAYQAASYSATVTGAISASVDINRQVYTCYIQSRHQYGDGTYTGYTARVNSSLRYGQTCAWSVGADATYQAASYSATVTGAISASLDINRQTYYLTVDRNASYIGSVSGAGYYRAGQTASIAAAASSGNEFTSWSQTAGTTSSFGNAAAASTTFVMPSSNATVYANGKSSKIYMQDLTSSNCPTTRTLVYDRRDEQGYYVQKMSDGRCWMTTNLNIAGGTTLTPATSNVTSNYTLPASFTASYGGTGMWGGQKGDGRAKVFNHFNTDCDSSALCRSYYSFAAATAATSVSAAYNNSFTSDSVGDICPAGWTLPSSGQVPSGAGVGAPWYLSKAGYFTFEVYTGEYYVGDVSAYWTKSVTPHLIQKHFGGYNGITWSVAVSGNDNGTNMGDGLAVRCMSK